jgi:hypothetical protein
MGDVLHFRADGRDRSSQAVARAQCEIVIFPGVRIERMAPADSDPGAGEPPPLGKLDGTNGRRRPRKGS